MRFGSKVTEGELKCAVMLFLFALGQRTCENPKDRREQERTTSQEEVRKVSFISRPGSSRPIWLTTRFFRIPSWTRCFQQALHSPEESPGRRWVECECGVSERKVSRHELREVHNNSLFTLLYILELVLCCFPPKRRWIKIARRTASESNYIFTRSYFYQHTINILHAWCTPKHLSTCWLTCAFIRGLRNLILNYLFECSRELN